MLLKDFTSKRQLSVAFRYIELCMEVRRLIVLISLRNGTRLKNKKRGGGGKKKSKLTDRMDGSSGI